MFRIFLDRSRKLPCKVTLLGNFRNILNIECLTADIMCDKPWFQVFTPAQTPSPLVQHPFHFEDLISRTYFGMEPKKRARFVAPPGVERRRSQRQHESSSSQYDQGESKFVVLVRKPRTTKKPVSSEPPLPESALDVSTAHARASIRALAGSIVDVTNYGNRLRQVVAEHESFGSRAISKVGDPAGAISSTTGLFGPEASVASDVLWSALGSLEHNIKESPQVITGGTHEALSMPLEHSSLDDGRGDAAGCSSMNAPKSPEQQDCIPEVQVPISKPHVPSSNRPMEHRDRYLYLWDTVMLLREFKGVDAGAAEEEEYSIDPSEVVEGPHADMHMSHDLNLDECMAPSLSGSGFEDSLPGSLDKSIGRGGSDFLRAGGLSSIGRQRPSFRGRKTIQSSAGSKASRVEDRTRSGNDRVEAGSEAQTEVRQNHCDLIARQKTNDNDHAEPLFATHYPPQSDQFHFESNLPRELSSIQRLTGDTNQLQAAFCVDSPERVYTDGSLHHTSLDSGESNSTIEDSITVDIARRALSNRKHSGVVRNRSSGPSFSSINATLGDALVASVASSGDRENRGSSPSVQPDSSTIPPSAAVADALSGSLCDYTYSVLDLVRLDEGRSPGYSNAVHPSILLDAFGLFFEDMMIFAPDQDSLNGTSAYLHTVDYAMCAALCREMSKRYESSHDRLMALLPLLSLYFGMNFEPFPSLTDRSDSSIALSALSVACDAAPDSGSMPSCINAVSCILAVQDELCLGSQTLPDECATKHFKNLFRAKNMPLLSRSICPTVFLLVAGPYLCIQLACVPDRARVFHATAFLPLIYNTTDSGSMVQVAVVVRCVKLLVKRLKMHYTSLDLNSKLQRVNINQLAFPFPTRFRSDERKELSVEMEYLQQLQPSRLVFSARVCNVTSGKRRVASAGQLLVVKFTRTYCPEAHRCCYEIDRSAPKLWSCTAMPGGWFMVVMEHIESSKAAGEVPVHVVKARLKRALFGLHCAGYVHGDVRVANVLTLISPQPFEGDTGQKAQREVKVCVREPDDVEVAVTDDKESAGDAKISKSGVQNDSIDSPLNQSKDDDADSSHPGDAPYSIVPRLRVCLLDFDGAGMAGKARYPAFMNRVDLRWPEGAREGGLIDASHDVQMLDAYFGKDATVEELEASDIYGHGSCFDDCIPECADNKQRTGPFDAPNTPPMVSSSSFFHDVNADPAWLPSVLGAEVWPGSMEESHSGFIVQSSGALGSDGDIGTFGGSFAHTDTVYSEQHVGYGLSSPSFRDHSGIYGHRESQETSSSIELDALDSFINSWTRNP